MSALRLIVLLAALYRPFDATTPDASLLTVPRTRLDPDPPTLRTRGPPDGRGVPRPVDGCCSALVRTIAAELAIPFVSQKNPVGRAAPDREP
jgi:hypothetical protein